MVGGGCVGLGDLVKHRGGLPARRLSPIPVLAKICCGFCCTACYTTNPQHIYDQAYSNYKHSLTFRVRRCCHSNETRAPIANPPNSAQLEGTLYHFPTYIRVRAVVWQCGEEQTYRHTDSRDQYTFRYGYDSCEM